MAEVFLTAAVRDQSMWDKIRYEWEKVGLSDRTLSARWGFKSGNSVTRRRMREGWVRDVDSITAKLVTERVADAGEAYSVRTAITPDEISHTASHVTLQVTGEIEGKTITDLTRGRGSYIARAHQDALNDARQMKTARGLAEVHAKAIADQIEIADAGVSVVSAMLNHLHLILTSTDIDKVQDSRNRLMALNPDKDSMAGHLKAIGALMEQSVKIKRLALCMDVTTQSEPVQVEQGRAQEVIKRLDVDTLMKMRQTALEVSQLPATIQGDDL